MRVSPGARVYLTTAISLAAVGLATWLGMEAGAAVAGRPWWVLCAVAASVTAAGVPAYEQIRKERLRARAEEAAVDAAVAMQVTMNDPPAGGAGTHASRGLAVSLAASPEELERPQAFQPMRSGSVRGPRI